MNATGGSSPEVANAKRGSEYRHDTISSGSTAESFPYDIINSSNWEQLGADLSNFVPAHNVQAQFANKVKVKSINDLHQSNFPTQTDDHVQLLAFLQWYTEFETQLCELSYHTFIFDKNFNDGPRNLLEKT